MKKLCALLLFGMALSSCAKVEVNNDPIIGVWQKTIKTAGNRHQLMIDQEEYIFNDVYLGRFHGYINGKLTFMTDFRWERYESDYIISYPGTDFPPDRVMMDETGQWLRPVRDEVTLFAERKQ